jgi:hypothetical protein
MRRSNALLAAALLLSANGISFADEDPLAATWRIASLPAEPALSITQLKISLPNAAGMRSVEVYGRCKSPTKRYFICKWGDVTWRELTVLSLPASTGLPSGGYLPCSYMRFLLGFRAARQLALVRLDVASPGYPPIVCSSPAEVPPPVVDLYPVLWIEGPRIPRSYPGPLPRVPGT